MAEDLEELNKHVRTCIAVFVMLLALTLVTVAVSYLNIPPAAAITLALCIALVKATMVVSFFMHLISEKKLIFYSLGLAALFFIFLLVIPVATDQTEVKQTVEVQY